MGDESAANGRNRPSIPAMPTAPAAMAPENPATKDVHPVRKPAKGP